jgi:ketosteroid isomerase-like protein
MPMRLRTGYRDGDPALQNGHAMIDSFSDAAAALQAQWMAAFASADWPALAALYTADTAFYGSTPALHTDRAGVLAYFRGLPPSFMAARYAKPHILELGSDLFAASGTVVFTVRINGQVQDRVYRMSQIMRRMPEGWRIAVHHASPAPLE